MTRLVLPEFSETLADGIHVVRGSHQFEAVEVGHAALAGHHVARVGEFGTEVVVARGDDTADQRPVVLVIEEGDDLLGDVATAIDVGCGVAAAVRRQHQDVRLVDLNAAV